MMTTHLTPLYLGIDTGGTYTDGVLFDPQTRSVIKTVKVLTTHHDLKQCIAEVLEQLLIEQTSRVSLVSLSTTLATNAIAEGKRKQVALLLLGYDPDLVHRYNFHHQFGTEHYFFIQGRHDLNGVEQAPLDQAEVARVTDLIKGRVEAFAISSYGGPWNADHEVCAGEIITGMSSQPVVQAHHLSNELDSIQRATTASLNASLLSNTKDFLEAVQAMLARQGIPCQVLIVRGDGSLAKADYVRTRPVEIIHSGPATSTIGGQYLANVPTALVIDIGGTTTDIAFVDQGKLQIQDKAATVGPFRTCVHTIKTRSFGLGGDSRISFDRHQNLAIGPDRVIPIARLCSLFPHLKADLSHWLWEKPEMIYPDRLEYWILRREPSSPFADARTNRAIQILRDGPKRLPVLLKQAGAVSPVQIDAVELVQQDIIERAALTPTDLLHVTGEFTPWDGEAACILAKSVARIWDEDSNAFAERVRKEITARIVAEIIQFLSDKPLSEPSFNLNRNSLDRWMFHESMQPAHPSLGCSFLLKAPIVGIGAPAKSFLPLVAEALHTEIIFPEHYAVANAVGTVVGNVMAHQEGDVFPRVEGAVISGYYARAASAQRWFERYEEALEYIRALLIQQVAAEARAAGAEEVNIDCQEREVIQGMAHVSAWAIGKPGVDGNKKARPV